MDIFFVSESGIAEMYVGVNQSRGYDQSFSVDDCVSEAVRLQVVSMVRIMPSSRRRSALKVSFVSGLITVPFFINIDKPLS